MKKDLYAESYRDLQLVLKDENTSASRRTMMAKIARIVSLVFIYAFLAFFALIMIFPFYWMIITSLKGGQEIKQTIPTFWPMVIRWDN